MAQMNGPEDHDPWEPGDDVGDFPETTEEWELEIGGTTDPPSPEEVDAFFGNPSHIKQLDADLDVQQRAQEPEAAHTARAREKLARNLTDDHAPGGSSYKPEFTVFNPKTRAWEPPDGEES